MTQEPLVAVPYAMTELSEDEERHHIGEFIDYREFDYRGHYGEVMIDGAWHTLWAFGSEAEASRFITSWGGIHFDTAVQARVTERRWYEQELIERLAARRSAVP